MLGEKEDKTMPRLSFNLVFFKTTGMGEQLDVLTWLDRQDAVNREQTLPPSTERGMNCLAVFVRRDKLPVLEESRYRSLMVRNEPVTFRRPGTPIEKYTLWDVLIAYMVEEDRTLGIKAPANHPLKEAMRAAYERINKAISEVASLETIQERQQQARQLGEAMQHFAGDPPHSCNRGNKYAMPHCIHPDEQEAIALIHRGGNALTRVKCDVYPGIAKE
jgi:hypothetical protein